MVFKGEEIEDGLYLVNGRRKLYYQNEEWFEAPHTNGRYSGNIRRMEKQPKIIKTLEKIRYSI